MLRRNTKYGTPSSVRRPSLRHVPKTEPPHVVTLDVERKNIRGQELPLAIILCAQSRAIVLESL